ncbi:MAG: hypothetical protein EOO07_20550 [Chitinophagaceae bacterium]|nr:MAG: hypothetical protein EOO07_20550 [Chitinophagaceae bacterium]
MGENTEWHFPIMIFAALMVFFAVIRMAVGGTKFKQQFKTIFFLALICVVFGMLFGKYGATFRFKWWIYYPIPMLINVLLPPILLKMKGKEIAVYLLLSFLSAPFIHLIFSVFFDWHEYMPFWNIPSFKSMVG